MRSRTSLPGIITALALLAGQAGTALHLAVVDHHRCALHGELIETEHVVWPEGDRSRSEIASLTAAGEHHHDHCTIGMAPRGMSVSPDERADASLGSVAMHPLPPAATPPARHVLLLAPKTSPPASDAVNTV